MNPALISGGISLASGLLAGGGSGADREAADYRARSKNAILRAQAALRNQGQLTTGSREALGRFDTQSQDAIQDYADSLELDPYTDARSSAELNGLLGDLDTDYRRTESDTAMALQDRGIAGSSIATGEAAGLSNARTGAIGSAKLQLMLQKIRERKARMQERVGVLSGARNQYRNETLGGYGTDYSGELGLSGSYNGLAGEAEQRANQERQGQGDLFGSIGTIADAIDWGGTDPKINNARSRWHL